MNLVSVRCQHCGAPLQVGETARFVTCQFCKTELTVERTESAVFTQQIGEIRERTTQLAGEIEVIRLQNDIDRLDREWQMERERYMVAGKHGHRHEPGTVSSLLGGGLIAAVGLAIFVGMSTSNAPGMLPVFGLLVMVLGAASAVMGVNKAASLDVARRRYDRQRAMLMEQLSAAQGGR